MKPSEKQKAKRIETQVYDGVANMWDRLFVPATAPARKRLLELAQLKPGERVLDFGTGTGAAALLAARRVGSSGFVLGIDLSAAMLKKARENAARAGLKNVIFRRMDFAALRLADESFDAVISSFGTPGPSWDGQPALVGWRRVLVKGGRLCFCDGVGEDKVEGTFEEWFEKYKVQNPDPKLAARRALRSRISEEAKSDPYFDLNDASKVERIIESTGFTRVRHFTETFVAKLPSARALVDFLLSWDYAVEYVAMPREAQREFRREALHALRPFESSRGMSWPNDVIFFLASKD